MASDGYNKHFYNYTLDCLKSLDKCNRGRRHTAYSKDIEQQIINLTDSVNGHVIASFTSFLSDSPKPVFLEFDPKGSNVIFPGDIRISHNNIQTLIDANNRAIDFINNIRSIGEITFNLSNDTCKEKFLGIKIPYQKGGWNFNRWGSENEAMVNYQYYVPTKTHTITCIYLGTFTVEQILHINSILQYVLDNKL